MLKKFLSLVLCTSFAMTNLMPPAQAQSLMGQDLAPLPEPGKMVALSSPVNPPVLRGIKVFTNDPFNFNFILDPGDKDRAVLKNGKMDAAMQVQLKETTNRLLKYFLTTLTVPDNEIWVNLSPYEKDRIISEKFGQTEMGRDLLGQDYLLKQITASLMFPQGEAGKKFWAHVYKEASLKFGTTQIPVNTFNKVWIMPDKAVIYEKLAGNQATAFVVESSLKVMLESDYIAIKKHGEAAAVGAVEDKPLTDAQKLSRDVVRQVIIPILQKEVNEGGNFAPLRQVYNSILLAMWYKERMKGSILSSAYVNRDKIAGVNVADQAVAQKIWQRYVQAYKKGAFNLISEEKDMTTNEIIPRKYFAGGFSIDKAMLKIVNKLPLKLGLAGLLVAMVGCSNSQPGKTLTNPTGPPTVQGITFNGNDAQINLSGGVTVAYNPTSAILGINGTIYTLPNDTTTVQTPIAAILAAIPTWSAANPTETAQLNALNDELGAYADESGANVTALTGVSYVPGASGNVPVVVAIQGNTLQVYEGGTTSNGTVTAPSGPAILFYDASTGLIVGPGTGGLAVSYNTPAGASALQTLSGFVAAAQEDDQSNPVLSTLLQGLNNSPPEVNQAQLSSLPVKVHVVAKSDAEMNGGIDLTKNSTSLNVRNEGGAIKFNIDPAQLARIKSEPGLTPEVYTIYPLQSLPEFLGMNGQETQQLAA